MARFTTTPSGPLDHCRENNLFLLERNLERERERERKKERETERERERERKRERERERERQSQQKILTFSSDPKMLFLFLTNKSHVLILLSC